MKLAIFSLFISLSIMSNAFGRACTIESQPKIYIINSNNIAPTDIVLKSDCDEKTLFSFISFAKSFNGNINAEYLNSVLSEENKIATIKLAPSKIAIFQLDTEILYSLGLAETHHLANLHIVNNKSALLLDRETSLTYQMNAETLGNKNINLTLSKLADTRSTIMWAQAVLQINTRVIKAKQNISLSQKELSPSLFETGTIYTETPERYIQNIDQIAFYRNTRPLLGGTPLITNDLTPIDLVAVGRPTKVVLKSETLSLDTVAIPLHQGKFGDVVTLRNPKTNKKIVGKVINMNTVLVEM